MSWDAIGALAELIGALAVIVSVLYLAAQVRHGAADVRTNVIHSLHAKEVDLGALPATSVVLANAVEKAHTGGTLTEEERAVFTMWIYSTLVHFQQTHLEHRRLNVEADVIEAERIRLAGAFKPRIARAVWRRLKDRFTPEFQRYVDEECIGVDESPGSPA